MVNLSCVLPNSKSLHDRFHFCYRSCRCETLRDVTSKWCFDDSNDIKPESIRIYPSSVTVLPSVYPECYHHQHGRACAVSFTWTRRWRWMLIVIQDAIKGLVQRTTIKMKWAMTFSPLITLLISSGSQRGDHPEDDRLPLDPVVGSDPQR